jgi:hypothetical protein
MQNSAVFMLFCDPIAVPYILRSLCWSPDYEMFVLKLKYILFNKGDQTLRDLLSVTRIVGADTVTGLKGKCHCSINSELFHKFGKTYRDECTSLTINNAWPQQHKRLAYCRLRATAFQKEDVGYSSTEAVTYGRPWGSNAKPVFPNRL